MTDRSRLTPSPARYGVTAERSVAALRSAGWWAGDGPAEGMEPVVAALSRCADPELAALAVDRLREALGDIWPVVSDAVRHNGGFRGRLLGLLGTSTALGDFLVAHPDQWHRLATPERAAATEPAVALRRAVSAAAEHGGSQAEQVRALRTEYRGALAEIAAADLGQVVAPDDIPPVSYEVVTGALTWLAEAVLQVALEMARATRHGGGDCELAVIALGKCGGRELNYVSDVDVVFVADGDLRAAARLAATTMRIAREAAFEVDAGLRPEGKAGALVRTVDGHASYYRQWARTWEFQALLKARPVAGDPELGRRYLDAVTPLVWTAADRDHFVADVQAMRRRVEQQLPAGIADRELKLGRGGLRDVEFAVQLLQLVHGRADDTLHGTSTVEMLRALGRGGYVGREDATGLTESYVFLRTLEHRLQLRKLRRTHLLPAESDEQELRWLARATGLGPAQSRPAEQVLLTQYRRHAARIRRLHEKLFYRPLLESVSRVRSEALRLTPQQAEQRLAALGYAGPDGALHHIEALTAGVSRRAAIQGTLLPVLLDLLADTADPDGGLLAYRKMSEALADTPWYLRLLRDEGAVAQRLAFLLGTAKLIPELAMRAPEGLRLLADDRELAGRDPEIVAASLRSAVRRHPDLAVAVAAARSLRRQELLRVACADLLGLLGVPSVCEALTAVWTAVLQSALAVAERARAEQDGEAAARIAVIGMGRLGGGELGYGSDADVLFVCEAVEGFSDADAVRYATAVAEAVQRALGAPSLDPPLTVDTGLRPEGRSGPLVRTLDSYRTYYEKWAQVWESQALLRARPVAGDPELGERFIAAVAPMRYPAGGLPAARMREIRRIKARMENERIPRGSDPSTNTKLGRGGLSDVEWTVQLLQLQHADRVPALRTTSTLDGLTAAADAGLLAIEDVRVLRSAWLLATRARNVTMLVRGRASDALPTHGRELTAVARVVGDPDADDPGEFLDEYRRTTRQARAVVERVFFGS